jgi:Iron-containing alcohol dehydrogenase
MNPFTFQTTPSVLFEPGAVKKIAPIVQEMGVGRVLFVTDRGVRGAGLTRDAEASLEAVSELTVFEDVVADPPSRSAAAARSIRRNSSPIWPSRQIGSTTSMEWVLPKGSGCRSSSLPPPPARARR